MKKVIIRSGLCKIFLGFVLLLSFNSCKEDDSIVIKKIIKLPSNYSYSTGYCDVRTLGIEIPDTVTYKPSQVAVLPTVLLHMPPAGDQGQQGSCAAWAVVYGAGSYTKKKLSGSNTYTENEILSPSFIYNQIAKGICGCTSFPDHLYLLKNGGSAELALMKYDQNDCSRQPDESQLENGKELNISHWAKVDLTKIETVKSAILDSLPVVFAISVDEGFSTLQSPYVWNGNRGATRGNHGMVITGYDDTRQAFRIMNSWSDKWADNGFAWVDYNFLTTNALGPGYVIY